MSDNKTFEELLENEDYFEDGVMTITHAHNSEYVWFTGHRDGSGEAQPVAAFNRFCKSHKVTLVSITDAASTFNFSL